MDRPGRRRIAFRATISILMLALVPLALVAYAFDDSDQRRAMAATVQVIAVINPPDYKAPWQCRPTESLSGSGVLLEGGRVLTNAHVVANAVSIELKRMGLPDRYLAHVEFIDHASDLALLRVEKAEFATGAEALPLGDMPQLQAAVNVYGYPLNAQTVCTTEGVVSRVEYDTYAHAFNTMLMAQLDASINPGSSGGPAVVDGKIVGLAMQKPDDTEGAGQFIPAPVIRRFLADAADGRVDGVPGIGVGYQELESDALRASCGVSGRQTGVKVVEIGAGGSGDGVLRVGDVIVSIGDQSVANDGTVALDGERRIDFAWPIHGRQVGDRLDVGILRGGVAQHVTLTLRTGGALIDGPYFPERAPYRIFGGLVFQPVDMDLIIANRENLPTNVLLPAQTSAVATAARRQRVTLGRVLPHEVNRGYQDWGTELVESVDGVPVRDFAHFNELLDGAGGRWITILLDDASSVVLDLPAARAAMPAILKTFNIKDERFPAAPRAPVAAKAADPGTRAS
jgi:S1-C subfamily serine protease